MHTHMCAHTYTHEVILEKGLPTSKVNTTTVTFEVLQVHELAIQCCQRERKVASS